jgi:hypothetical protein
MLEPIMIMFIYCTLSTFLPLFFKCNRTGCFVDEATDEISCPADTSANMKRIVETSVQLYTCESDRAWSDFPAEVSVQPPRTHTHAHPHMIYGKTGKIFSDNKMYFLW